MTDVKPEPQISLDPEAKEWEIGGLHFTVAFRRADGATIRVYGPHAGGWTEMLRFDDFIDEPHYHVPAQATPFMFDRATRGEPLDWFIGQIRDNLGELLVAAGYPEVLASVDLGAIAARAEEIRTAMLDCVPEGYVRVPGIGIQPSER